MHITFNSLIAAGREQELARASRRGHLARRPQRRSRRIELRFAAPADGEAISRLAALDSKPKPDRPTLLAEIDGELVAAAPLTGGPAIADPFTPTRDVVELLERHARTLRHAA
jgi:hypothetical protein